MTQDTVQSTLESLIDQHSLSFILEELGAICDEKASHIQENWQDRTTARPWEQAGTKLLFLAQQLDI